MSSKKSKSTAKPKQEKAKPKKVTPSFTKDTRPIECKKLATKMTTWFALQCHSAEFDTELCCSILSKYWFQIRKLKKDSEDALSDKQYNILHNIFIKFRVNDVFNWEALSIVCCDISDFGDAEIVSTSGLVCENYYFETKEPRAKYTVDEFIDTYRHHIKHTKFITELSELDDDDFV